PRPPPRPAPGPAARRSSDGCGYLSPAGQAEGIGSPPLRKQRLEGSDFGARSAERLAQLLGGRWHEWMQERVHRAQPFDQRRERLVELGGIGWIARELPWRALFDVSVQPAHPLPDELERLRGLGPVHQRRDILREPLQVG